MTEIAEFARLVGRDTYDRVMAEERRTAVLVAPDRIYSNG